MAGGWLIAGLALAAALALVLAVGCRRARCRAVGRRSGRTGSAAERGQELPPDPSEEELPPCRFASRDYFLAQCKTIDRVRDRVVLTLIQPDPGISEPEQFLRRLEQTLRPAIRRDDWLALFPEERLLLIIGRIPAGGGESMLGRLAEVIRREESCWAASGKPGEARSRMALAVYPTDGTEFPALLNLARHRLEKGICWNIQPPS